MYSSFMENIPRNINVDIIRISALTGIGGTDKDSVQAVCDVMAHTQKTQREHFWPRERELAAFKGTSALRNYFFIVLLQLLLPQYLPRMFIQLPHTCLN